MTLARAKAKAKTKVKHIYRTGIIDDCHLRSSKYFYSAGHCSQFQHHFKDVVHEDLFIFHWHLRSNFAGIKKRLDVQSKSNLLPKSFWKRVKNYNLVTTMNIKASILISQS